MRSGDTDESCVKGEKRLCFECVEGMATTLDACVACERAQRCVDGSHDLLCRDNGLLNGTQCTQSTQQDVLLITNNHVVKCTETHFMDGEACGGCQTSCASCDNASSCSVCAAGTSLSQDSGCVHTDNAVVETHNGIIACDEAFVALGGACASCADRFSHLCPSCSLCDAEKCVWCDGDVVFENGTWRPSQHCAVANGTVCQSCIGGSVPFNATDCVPAGDCAVYEDGKCVQCANPFVPDQTGLCVESDQCSEHFNGVCLRCVAGMYVDEGGVCHGLSCHETHV